MDRAKKYYMYKIYADRGAGIEQAKRKYMKRERRKLFFSGYPLSGNEVSGL